MTQAFQNRRLGLLASALVLGFAGLGARLYDVQVVRHATLQEKADDLHDEAIIREPRRGDIRDGRGNLLATSRPVLTVAADPTLVGSNSLAVARALAPLLQWDAVRLADRLRVRTYLDRAGQTQAYHYVVLRRKVRLEDWPAIQQAMSHLELGGEKRRLSTAEKVFRQNLRAKAVFAEPDYLRVYPGQGLAAHVIGYVGTREAEAVLDDPAPVRKRILETYGRDGIERTFNGELAGVRGWRLTEVDRQKRELVAFREEDVAPRAGLNVVLTLDATLQHVVETELAKAMLEHSPASASAIVVRPRTGEILALATLPGFDLNDPGRAPLAALRNRVITDMWEPGSTFKVVTVSAALNEHVVTLDDRFDCKHGYFFFAGQPLHDHERFGVLSVAEIIARSSNIGAAQVGIRMGPALLYRYIRNFGFGDPTGIRLPGEVRGLVRPVSDWSKISIARIPMGQGIAVTPLQMVMAMAAIANGGYLMAPMLVDRLEDENGAVVARNQPLVVRRVVSEAAARQMVAALKLVVSTNGTALKARLEHYTVAGKTGTAQEVVNGAYSHTDFFSSFIGFFPADAPELCISVVLDAPRHGYYGGQVAAPVFRNIAERAANYLNIRPEAPGSGGLAANQRGGRLTGAASD
ncbi:MAG: penicillin-binding protein 2 [Verrucomicrobia bacterium]|nr:penicillin-binding protein 2 [Verrucomicrobiota bacterium]